MKILKVRLKHKLLKVYFLYNYSIWATFSSYSWFDNSPTDRQLHQDVYIHNPSESKCSSCSLKEASIHHSWSWTGCFYPVSHRCWGLLRFSGELHLTLQLSAWYRPSHPLDAGGTRRHSCPLLLQSRRPVWTPGQALHRPDIAVHRSDLQWKRLHQADGAAASGPGPIQVLHQHQPWRQQELIHQPESRW